jgi:hypothetical protein
MTAQGRQLTSEATALVVDDHRGLLQQLLTRGDAASSGGHVCPD